jgi:CheY-specific phosphatase CheX
MSRFREESQEPFFIVQLSEPLNEAALDQIDYLSKNEWIQKTQDTFVLDLGDVQDLPPRLFKIVVAFKQSLRQKNKDLFTICTQANPLRQIVAAGMTLVLNPVANLSAALEKKRSQAPKQTINTEFINPFISATKLTLEIQGKTPVEVGKPLKKDPASPIPSSTQIAAVLSLDAGDFQGSLVLCFPEPVFLNIYSNMFNETHTSITAEVQDAASELLNIIFGLAKRELNDKKGFKIKLAIPSVMVGQNIEIPMLHKNNLVITIPCTTSAGSFQLEIHIGPIAVPTSSNPETKSS